ncbi:Receptor-transporting protein 5 [Camelus dromedarius]|uniref:Receptor-transporting protein 5 n=2 Tax=Camelus TaxID=9836 RepID=A0A5N4E8M2_CAMDR|nr:receptor-transporting protein 5 isoform X1 [Camelus ferus]XP_010986794.1 receptor-transporting protein 5 isoform X1 [Camelus dromedarius]EPY83361.1 hypothetical protein CB1_000575020 [Camelus ferus]KAB1279499.1 Receptor-transporting protein 5 [Camelus dromedarius]
MDGVDVWASTLAQLMAKRKPQDTWELVPEENLASGHVDSRGFQYRLRGLSRLQCGRCQWGWSSAHVHILFHLWWDEDSRLGLVKMRLWGQQCRVCPPGGDTCQASLLNVRLFLNKLVQFIVQKCYAEGPGADQCPEICFGERCEACDLGVCFFQKPPDPAWGPEVKSPSAGKGSTASPAPLNSHLAVERSRGYSPRSITAHLLEDSTFFHEDEDVVTVPFSLVRKDKGPTAEHSGQATIGRGSLYLPASSKTTPKGRSLLVNLRAPIFHGKGPLLSSIKPLETTNFIYKGRGCMPIPDEDEDEDPEWSLGHGQSLAPDGDSPQLLPYVVGLTNHGEGSLTFPSALADLIEEEDDPAILDGSLTFPFIFANQSKGGPSSACSTKGKGEDGGRGPLSGTSARGSLATSSGSITIPYSVLGVIRHKGSGPAAGGPQSGCDQKRRQRRSVLGRCPREEDFCCVEGCCVPRFDPYEEVWVWVSVAACVLWILYLYTVSPDSSPRG